MQDKLNGKHPLVSIICFCRNAAKTIRRCIDSILAQDYANVEVIVQDGASTDGTVKILQEYGSKIKLVSEPDSGPMDAMYRALGRINGEFFGSCLSDEELLPHAVSWAIDNLTKYPEFAAIYGDHYITDINGSITGEVTAPEWDFEKYFCSEMTPPFCASFFRRSCYEATGMREYVGTDEFDLWIALGARFPIRHVPGLVAKYAEHVGQGSVQEHIINKLLDSRKAAIERLCHDPRTGENIRLLRNKAIAGLSTWLILCYCNIGSWDLAKKHARQLLTRETNPERLRRLAIQFCKHGMELQRTGYLEEALEYFDLLVKSNFVCSDLNYQKAKTLFRLGRMSEAIKASHDELKLQPNHRSAKAIIRLAQTCPLGSKQSNTAKLAQELFRTGFQFLCEGSALEAAKYFDEAAADCATLPNINLARATAYAQIGNLRSAREACETELSLQPDHNAAKRLLKRIDQAMHGRQGDKEKSKEDEYVGGKPPPERKIKIQEAGLSGEGHDRPRVDDIEKPFESQIVPGLLASLTGPQVKNRVLSIISRLEKDHWLEADIENYRSSTNSKAPWFDALVFLNWYAHHFKPDNYLEVGVRRGRSMSQVLAESPQTNAYGFDIWKLDYGSSPEKGIYTSNPGAGFVVKELEKIGVTNLPTLVSGNSRQTLPLFFGNSHNPKQFELVFIDGDHRYDGAKSDLDIAFEHLAPGGALVFDDINHHAHPELGSLWNEYKTKFPDYIFIEDHHGTGTAVVFRPPFTKLLKFLDAPTKLPEKKMKLLLVYSLHPVTPKITLPEWIKEALRKYHASDVEVFACGPGNEIDIPDSPDFYDKVAEVVRNLEIDAIWDIEGGAASRDFMFKRIPRKISVPKVWWAIDTHQYLPLMVEKAKHFDLVFSAQKNAVGALGPRAFWLPAGASIYEVDYHRERTIDVGFIGNINPNVHHRRKKIIERLQKEFPGFKCFANVFLREKAELASRTKIMVNVSLRNDINFRVFETLACGAMLITDRIYDNGLEELFEDGKHLVTFETEDELIDKIQYYLKHEEQRRRIAGAGQQRVLQQFSHRVLLKKPLNLIAKLINQHRKTAQQPAALSAPGTARCWCKGQLKDSVHPRYGQCRDCGTLVLKEQPNKEHLKAFYTFEGYWHDHVVNVSGHPPIEQRATRDFGDRIPVWYELLRKRKPQFESLLEIGCAHGGFLHYCRQRGVDNVVGVEADEQTCEFARKHFNLPKVVGGLFPDVSVPLEKFDVIAGFDVVEHFSEPVRAMRKVAELLDDDGIYFFQVPCHHGEGAQWVQFRPHEHIFLYNEESIRQLLECAGLEVTEIVPGYFPDDVFVLGRKKPIRNLLFVRTDSIGDNVLAASMLPHIRQKFADARITVLCQEHIAELYEVCPHVDDVIAFNRKRIIEDQAYRQDVMDRLRRLRPKLSLNSVFSREPLTDVLAIECGAEQRVALEGDLDNISAELRRKHNQFYTKLLPSKGSHKPELDRHRDFLRGLGINVSSSLKPVIWTAAEDDKAAERFFEENNFSPRETIALFAGAQHPVRLYEKYGQSLADFCKENHLRVVGLGTEKERDINQRNLDAIGVETINLCGKVSLRQAAAILRRCRMAVGAETGLAHICCAVGTANVILLGGGHFGRFMPYSPLTSVVCLPLKCYDCNWRCKYRHSHCIKDIKPEVITEALRRTFAHPSEKPRAFIQGTSLWDPEPGQPAWRSFDGLLNLWAMEIIPVGQLPPGTFEDWKGLQLLSSGDVEGALGAFTKAVEEAPNSVVAHNNMGGLYLIKGEVKNALQHFLKALRIDRYDRTTVLNCGQVLTKAGRIEEARKLYLSYLQENPDDNQITKALENLDQTQARAAREDVASRHKSGSMATPLKPRPEQRQSMDKRSKYLVSAIVSTYNAERFIRGCLEDLVTQTLFKKGQLEIVVVNSGSEQNEEAVIHEYQQKYGNINYIRTEKRETIYEAWNRAVKAAQGQFTTNANTDDRHREDALEIMGNTLLANPDVALVYADQIRTDTPVETFADHHGNDRTRLPDYSRERLLFGCCVGSQPMWRRSLHNEFGYFDETLTVAADWDFWLRISSKHKFKHIPQFVGLYYYNPDGNEHRKKIHSLYERYVVGKRYGNPYISVIPMYQSKNNPLVSVIMPAFNAARYIAEAIESVLIQNYRNFELIVVDDGSTDDTEDIVASFKDNQIRYFYKENRGAASARNLAIRKSRGAFIVNLDTDDMITPDFIARHLVEFERHPDADLVYCDDCLIDESDKPIRVIERPEYSDRKFLIRDLFRCGFPIVPFRTCVRRRLFDKIGYYDEDLLVAEDYDMIRRLVKQGLKTHHLKDALYLRRITPYSLSRSARAQKAKCHFDVLKRFVDTFSYDELFPDVKWDRIAPERRRLHAKCLAAITCLAIGQTYVQSNSPVYAETAFGRACSELNDCLKIDPHNQRVRKLLQKCEFARARYAQTVQQTVC